MYQFRFGGKESVISDIFKEEELSKNFETVFMDNYNLLLSRIREYSKFILSKNKPNAEVILFSIHSSEDEIIAVFKEDLKRILLYQAINDVFSGNLDVKENITKRLTDSFIKQSIMKDCLLNSFNKSAINIVDVTLNYEVFEELISEFLQK